MDRGLVHINSKSIKMKGALIVTQAKKKERPGTWSKLEGRESTFVNSTYPTCFNAHLSDGGDLRVHDIPKGESTYDLVNSKISQPMKYPEVGYMWPGVVKGRYERGVK